MGAYDDYFERLWIESGGSYFQGDEEPCEGIFITTYSNLDELVKILNKEVK